MSTTAEAPTLSRDYVMSYALSLLEEHGEDMQWWEVHFDQSKSRLGACDFVNERLIFSEHMLAHSTEEAVDDTIRHEVAHALAGPFRGHGPVWQEWAVRLGARPSRRAAPGSTALSAYLWVGTCPDCGWQVGRHRLTRAAHEFGHAPCMRAAKAEGREVSLLVWGRSR